MIYDISIIYYIILCDYDPPKSAGAARAGGGALPAKAWVGGPRGAPADGRAGRHVGRPPAWPPAPDPASSGPPWCT